MAPVCGGGGVDCDERKFKMPLICVARFCCCGCCTAAQTAARSKCLIHFCSCQQTGAASIPVFGRTQPRNWCGAACLSACTRWTSSTKRSSRGTSSTSAAISRCPLALWCICDEPQTPFRSHTPSVGTDFPAGEGAEQDVVGGGVPGSVRAAPLRGVPCASGARRRARWQDPRRWHQPLPPLSEGEGGQGCLSPQLILS